MWGERGDRGEKEGEREKERERERKREKERKGWERESNIGNRERDKGFDYPRGSTKLPCT